MTYYSKTYRFYQNNLRYEVSVQTMSEREQIPLRKLLIQEYCKLKNFLLFLDFDIAIVIVP